MTGLNENNLFRMDCADCRAAITRFFRGSLTSVELITILRAHAELRPALRPLATAWMEADRIVGIERLTLPADDDARLWTRNCALETIEAEPIEGTAD